MKKLLPIIFVLCLAVNVYSNDIPYYDICLRIHKIKYQKHTYNCLWKSRMLHNYLLSNGIKSRLVIGYYLNNKIERHAWIEYENNGKWYCIDLTMLPKFWGRRINYYKKHRPVDYYYEIFMREKQE